VRKLAATQIPEERREWYPAHAANPLPPSSPQFGAPWCQNLCLYSEQLSCQYGIPVFVAFAVHMFRSANSIVRTGLNYVPFDHLRRFESWRRYKKHHFYAPSFGYSVTVRLKQIWSWKGSFVGSGKANCSNSISKDGATRRAFGRSRFKAWPSNSLNAGSFLPQRSGTRGSLPGTVLHCARSHPQVPDQAV